MVLKTRQALIAGIVFTIFAVVLSAARSDEPVRQGITTLVACVIGVGLVVLIARAINRRGGPGR